MINKARIWKLLIILCAVVCAAAAPAWALDAPANFRTTSVNETSINWAWGDVNGEDGYDIYEDGTDELVIPEVGKDVTSTTETGLTPNTTYSRYVRAYVETTYQNCSAVNSGYCLSGANYPDNPIRMCGNILSNNRGWCKFDLASIPSGADVIDVKFYGYVYDEAPTDGVFDLTKITSDPETAGASTLFNEIGSGTVFLSGSTEHRTVGYKCLTLNSDAYTWVEGSKSFFGWCALGFKESSQMTNFTMFREWNYSDATQRPVLEVTYGGDSGPSNVVQAVTLAAVPKLYNSSDTFLFRNRFEIVVQVDLNGNPDGTDVELYYAKGDAFGPTEAWISAGLKTSGYVWSIDGLMPLSQYWFKSKACNHSDVWTADSDWATESTNDNWTQFLPFKGYHMIWVPCYTGNQTVWDLLGDDIAITVWGQPTVWGFRYREDTDEWIQLSKTETLQNDTGYMFWAPKPTIIDMTGESVGGDGNIIVNLSWTNNEGFANDGWNLVRNPFSRPVQWTTVFRVYCDAVYWGPITEQKEYEWYQNESSHSAGGVNEIPPGGSIWVHANGAGAYLIFPDPGACPAPAALPPPALNWRMGIEARTGSCADTGTYIAVRENADEGHDWEGDVLEISPFATEYIQAYFSHPEWGYYAGPYTQDAKPFPYAGGMVTWDMTVHATNAAGQVDLRWSVPEGIRDGWQLYLRDNSTGLVMDMSCYEDYSYPAGGEDTRMFTLTAARLKELLLGDTDLNGYVDAEDARTCARAEQGLEELSPEQRQVSDLNGDGEVDVLDALLILKRISGHLKP